MNPNIALIINYICNGNFNYTQYNCFPSQADIAQSNAIREEFKQRLILGGFNVQDFYVPTGSPLKKDTLFYILAYGVEAKIVGTGLFESSFREVFTHLQFPQIIKYIYPPIAGGAPLNLGNQNNLFAFCNGLFNNFTIPNFTQVLPIRLASYFYPEHFLPIFKLDELKKLCILCGYNGPHPAAKGARLFNYNSFLLSRINILQQPNINALQSNSYIKSYAAYLAFYTVELYNRLQAGQTFNNILPLYKKLWEKRLITCGLSVLGNLPLLPPLPPLPPLPIIRN